MVSEKDLLACTIHSDPPVYTKRVKKHRVYLIPPSGSILKGRLKGIVAHQKMDKLFGKRVLTIDVPAVLQYDNRPEYDVQEFPISNLAADTLRERIREAFEKELQRIWLTSPR